MIWKTWRSAHSEGSVRFSIPADIALSVDCLKMKHWGCFFLFTFVHLLLSPASELKSLCLLGITGKPNTKGKILALIWTLYL